VCFCFEFIHSFILPTFIITTCQHYFWHFCLHFFIPWAASWPVLCIVYMIGVWTPLDLAIEGDGTCSQWGGSELVEGSQLWGEFLSVSCLPAGP
jgi:hypothetical protein